MSQLTAGCCRGRLAAIAAAFASGAADSSAGRAFAAIAGAADQVTTLRCAVRCGYALGGSAHMQVCFVRTPAAATNAADAEADARPTQRQLTPAPPTKQQQEQMDDDRAPKRD